MIYNSDKDYSYVELNQIVNEQVKEIERLKLGKDRTLTLLCVLINELYGNDGYLKKKYKEIVKNEYVKAIEPQLISIHAGIHCGVEGVMAFKAELERLMNELKEAN